MVKHLVLPLHERVLGRSTLECLRSLERSQWMDPTALAELQRRKLRSLLQLAYARCPFHRARMDDAGLHPGADLRLANLRALPPLTKDDIRRNLQLMIYDGVAGRPRRRTTGGSCGEPLAFYVDCRRQAHDQAARLRAQRWFGVDIGQPQVYLWGSPIEQNGRNRIRRWRDRLVNHIMLDAFEMTPAGMDVYLDRIEGSDPVSLFGYPSSLALLARHAIGRERALRLCRLRAVFVTGETLSPRDRQDIHAAFAAPVVDGYGSREAGFIAHECPAGRLHVTDESVVVEILNDRGELADPGRIGRVVVTHLDNHAMPLIRYDTGDLGRREAGDARCACGRGLSVMAGVEGRRTDFLVASDGTLRHALSAIYILREIDGIERYRIVQHQDFSLTVELVCNNGLAPALGRFLIRELQPLVGPNVPIHIRNVPQIDSPPSGKLRPVVSTAVPCLS